MIPIPLQGWGHQCVSPELPEVMFSGAEINSAESKRDKAKMLNKQRAGPKAYHD